MAGAPPPHVLCFQSRLKLTTISHMPEFLMGTKNELLCTGSPKFISLLPKVFFPQYQLSVIIKYNIVDLTMMYFKLKAEMNFALINCFEMDSKSISLYKTGSYKTCLVVFPSLLPVAHLWR